MEDGDASVVGGRQEDSTAQANLSRRTHPSMRTKRRKEVVHARANPLFRARKRYAKNIRCICTPSGMVCYTGTCLPKTLILQRLNAWLWTQLERWKVVIRSSGTVLGRSGRSQHPTAQHYSPNAKATFEERDNQVPAS